MTRKACEDNVQQAQRCRIARPGMKYVRVPVYVKSFNGTHVVLNAKKRGSNTRAKASPSLPPLVWGGDDMWKDCPSDMDVDDGTGNPIVGQPGELLLNLTIAQQHGLGWSDPKWPDGGGAGNLDYRTIEISPTRITLHGYNAFSDDPVEGEIELFNEQMVDPTQTTISWNGSTIKLKASKYVFTQKFFVGFPDEENLRRAENVILKTGGTPKEMAEAWKAIDAWSSRLARRRASDETDEKIQAARAIVDAVMKHAGPTNG
jgi:hypothetical protein